MKSSDAIELRVGQEHRVKLSPAASGGYLWSFRVGGDAASVSVAEDTSAGEKSSHPARGESLDQEFVVRAEQAGDAVVEFEHSRSWEEAPVADSYTLRVHVAG